MPCPDYAKMHDMASQIVEEAAAWQMTIKTLREENERLSVEVKTLTERLAHVAMLLRGDA
jgi:regulator of replication initiation timing